MQKNSDNIYETLGLPLTAKWTDVKRTYDAAMNETGQMKKQADAEQTREIEKKQSHLKNLFTGFSKKVSTENSRMFQTRQALKSVGLSESVDWDTVQKQENDFAATSGRDNNRSADWETLHRNRDLLLRNPKRKNHTVLTAAAAFAGAGISLAAYHYLNNMDSDTQSGNSSTANHNDTTSGSENDHTHNENTEPADLLEEHTQQLQEPEPPVSQEEIDAYVAENSQLDGEMMSLLGLAPSPELTLTIDFKMQAFSALIKTI